MLETPQPDKLNITNTESGARTTSLYTERKIKIFGISEPELDSVSHFNTSSLTYFSFGSFLINIFIDNMKEASTETYKWFLDPIGWATGLLYVFGAFALIQRHSIVKKIKSHSRIIGQ